MKTEPSILVLPWFTIWNKSVLLQMPVRGGSWSWECHRAACRFDISWFVLVPSPLTSCILFPPKSCNTFLATLFPPVLAEKGGGVGNSQWGAAEWRVPWIYLSHPLGPTAFSWGNLLEMHQGNLLHPRLSRSTYQRVNNNFPACSAIPVLFWWKWIWWQELQLPSNRT